jgi:hypothetical protein
LLARDAAVIAVLDKVDLARRVVGCYLRRLSSR